MKCLKTLGAINAVAIIHKSNRNQKKTVEAEAREELAEKKAVDEGGSKTTSAANWEGKTSELAKKSPIEIPGDATVKIQHKAGGYDQISYKWSDGKYKYESRWHTPTPNAPKGSPNSWVIERTTPGTATVQQKVQSMYTLSVNSNWTPKWEWEAAVDAYNKGTTTQLQDAILNSGHINAP